MQAWVSCALGGDQCREQHLGHSTTTTVAAESEADAMSAMKFRNEADKALRSALHFYNSRRVPERKHHHRYRHVVQACLLHTGERWGWANEFADALHGLESHCLEMDRARHLAGSLPCKQDPSCKEAISTA